MFRRQLLDWLDWKFFREAYHRERILLALLADMDKLDSVSGIARLVSIQVEFALHPKAVYIWYREKEGDTLTLAYHSGTHVRRVNLPSDPSSCGWLNRSRGRWTSSHPTRIV